MIKSVLRKNGSSYTGLELAKKTLTSTSKSTLKTNHLLVKLKIICDFKHGLNSNHIKYLKYLLLVILKKCHFCYLIRSMNVALLINSICSTTAIIQNYIKAAVWAPFKA